VAWLALALLVLALLGSACGNDADRDGASGNASGSGTGGAAGVGGTGGEAGGEAGGGPEPPPGSCIQPGDKGNDKGVGEFCTPGGGECDKFALAPFCLADVGQDQWFCTRIGCDAMTDCGQGAGCLIVSGMGSACVPCKCEPSGVGCASGGAGGAGGGAGGAGGG
jgi:hypothetical protein